MISPAFIGGAEAVEGDSSFLGLRFELSKDLDKEPVLLSTLLATAAGGLELTAQVIGDLIVTTDAPCGGAICWDGEPCTLDSCDAESCSYALDTAPCDDGNPCTTGDLCGEGGLCAGTTLAPQGAACAGANLCTQIGACDALGACVYDELLNVACDDADTACFSFTCEPSTGGCVSQIHGGVSCDDGSACSEFDACGPTGDCLGKPVLCNDGVGCTVDDCDPATGCFGSPDDGPCDDGNACTDDACLDTGCEHAPNTVPCEDGDPCTLTDACELGQCSWTRAVAARRPRTACRSMTPTCATAGWSARRAPARSTPPAWLSALRMASSAWSAGPARPTAASARGRRAPTATTATPVRGHVLREQGLRARAAARLHRQLDL